MIVADLELTDSEARRRILGDAGPARTTLRLHGIPVGVATLEGSRATRQRAVGRALLGSARLPILEELARRQLDHGLRPTAWATPGPPQRVRMPELDIAICTRDRPDDLARTLQALAPYAGNDVRIIVVDNAPSNTATRDVVERSGVEVTYRCEPAPGLDHARNHALDVSRAPVLAFVDDDVVVDAGWVTAVRRAFRSPDVAMVTGLVEPWSMASEAARCFEAFGGFGRGFQCQWLAAPRRSAIAMPWANTGRHGTGANLSFRRALLLAVGGFDPALDAGTPAAGGGDLEAMFRILKAGGVQLYAPHAMVRHAHRSSMEGLLGQIESWGTGMSAHVESIRCAFPDERGALRRLDAWRYTARYARRLGGAMIGPPWPPRLAWHELRGATRGAALYHQGGRSAAPRAWKPLPEPGHGSRDVTLELTDDAPALAAEGAATLRIAVQREGQPIGTITVNAADGWVGRDRARDLLIRNNLDRISGADGERAIKELVALGGA